MFPLKIFHEGKEGIERCSSRGGQAGSSANGNRCFLGEQVGAEQLLTPRVPSPRAWVAGGVTATAKCQGWSLGFLPAPRGLQSLQSRRL